MVRAFELAFTQLTTDPKLRGVLWQSLLLSLVLQVALIALAWWGLTSFATFKWQWLNDSFLWLTHSGVIVLGFLLFPASFGIVVSIFMERIADIVESKHYPQLGPARGISIWTALWTGVAFLVAVILLNLLLLVPYLIALIFFGAGAVLFYALNGWLTARMYYEQVALRRRSAADVKAWRRANAGILWLTGIVIVFLGTIPVLNLLIPVVGTAAMVHVAQTLKAPAAPWRPFNPPA